MVYRGRVKNGQIVLEGDVRLPEGAAVEVTMVESGSSPANEERPPTLYDLLKQFVGMVDLPEDMSVNHDHYLYGVPKKK